MKATLAQMAPAVVLCETNADECKKQLSDLEKQLTEEIAARKDGDSWQKKHGALRGCRYPVPAMSHSRAWLSFAALPLSAPRSLPLADSAVLLPIRPHTCLRSTNFPFIDE